MRDDLTEVMVQIAREKEIPQEVVVGILQQAILTAYRKNFPGQAPDIRVEVDPSLKEFHVYRRYTVVDDEVMDCDEMLLDDARRFDPNCQAGDIVEVELHEPALARIAAQTARQVIVQRIRDWEKERIYAEYSQEVDHVLSGTISRREHGNVIVALNKAEGIMPPGEQVRTEPYRYNERYKVYLLRVDKDSRGPRIIVSRKDTRLVRRLFELEVPEIADGTVIIKGVAREAGSRSKIAVMSRDERVDPLGSCVGHRGSRVQAVVNELRGEKIDIIRWSPDPVKFIAEALSPAKVATVQIQSKGGGPSGQRPTALVIVPDNQLSLAIGKSGQNVRLAASLTGWHIDIRSESQIAQGASASAQASQEAPTTQEDGEQQSAEA